MSVPKKRTYTIAEAAEATGLSRKAVARRVERGSLRSLVRGGRRLIPRTELVRADLLPGDPESRDYGALTAGLPSPQGAPLPDPLSPLGDQALASLLRELLERLERQAGEIAQFRAITAQAESLRSDHEVSELRVRLAALENERRHDELEAGGPVAREGELSLGYERQSGVANERIWLPASAGAAEARGAPVPGEAAERDAASGGAGRSRNLNRRIAFAVEALLIVGVAAGTWLADLPPTGIVAAVGTAWIVVAVLEWLRYGDR